MLKIECDLKTENAYIEIPEKIALEDITSEAAVGMIMLAKNMVEQGLSKEDTMDVFEFILHQVKLAIEVDFIF